MMRIWYFFYWFFWFVTEIGREVKRRMERVLIFSDRGESVVATDFVMQVHGRGVTLMSSFLPIF